MFSILLRGLVKWWLPFVFCFIVVFWITMPSVPERVPRATNLQEVFEAIHNSNSFDGARYREMIEIFLLALPGTGIAFVIATAIQYSFLESHKESESIIVGNIIYVFSSIAFVLVLPEIIRQDVFGLHTNVYGVGTFIVAPAIPLFSGGVILYYLWSKRLSEIYDPRSLASKP